MITKLKSLLLAHARSQTTEKEVIIEEHILRMFGELQEELARLREVNRWIPITDDNPKLHDVVNIQIQHKKYGTKLVVSGCRMGQCGWYVLQGLEFSFLPSDWTVISWFPLPDLEDLPS